MLLSPSKPVCDEFNGTVVSFDMKSKFKAYRPSRLSNIEALRYLKMLQGSAVDSIADSVIESDGKLS